MCGLPYHAAHAYIGKILPRAAKSPFAIRWRTPNRQVGQARDHADPQPRHHFDDGCSRPNGTISSPPSSHPKGFGLAVVDSTTGVQKPPRLKIKPPAHRTGTAASGEIIIRPKPPPCKSCCARPLPILSGY